MFTTIFIGVMAVATALCAIIGKASDTESRDAAQFGVLVFGVLGAVATALGCVTVVGATETGVPVSFGRVGDPMASGIHVKAPWTKVHGLPKRPLPVDDMTVVARTSQAGQMSVTVGARWHVDPDGATTTYLQVRTGDEEKISRQVVSKALGQVVSEVYSGMDNALAARDRTGAQEKIKEKLMAAMYSYGVRIDDVFLRSVEPDKVTANVIARLASQEQETAISREAQATAREDAKRRRIEAEGLRAAAAGIPSGVSGGQVELLCAQAWERQAAKAIAAGVPLYTGPCGGSTPVVAGR